LLRSGCHVILKGEEANDQSHHYNNSLVIAFALSRCNSDQALVSQTPVPSPKILTEPTATSEPTITLASTESPAPTLEPWTELISLVK